MSDDHASATVSEADLVAALLRPKAYPHPVDEVELRRTHLSLVFLAGDFAYKLKRGVDLGFVDFTTLDARRIACDDELRLNRRLAPGVYLGTVAIVRADDGTISIATDHDGDERAEVIDCAVRMVRLDDAHMLDRMLAADAVTWTDLARLGDKVAEFLRGRERDSAATAFGTPEALRKKFMNHLTRMTDDLAPDGEMLHPPTFVAHLRAWTDEWLVRHDALLRRRADDGHVREGHGDLHTANIAFVEGRWLILDCVEFRRDFRCLDSAAEIAVLTMDVCHRADDRSWGHRLREHIGTALQIDRHELDVLHKGYGAHYAAVRAHVGALAAWSSDRESGRDRALATSRAYLGHAIGLTLPQRIVLLCGLPGSGKSVVASSIAQSLEAMLVSSDLTRKALAGLAPSDRSGSAVESSIYTAAMTERTLERMLDAARSAMITGASVVIDATNGQRRWRDAFAEVARRAGVSAALVWLDLPDATIRQRLRMRLEESDQPSDADERVYELMRQRFERPDEWPFDQLVPVLDALPPEAIVERVLAVLIAGQDGVLP